jgi:hypothetical protein
MATYEHSLKDFDLWRAEIIAAPPPIKEFAGSTESAELERREMERLLLTMDVEEIRQRTVTFGVHETASLHWLPRTDGYLTAYLGRTYPEGQEPSGRYVRVITNEVTRHAADYQTAVIEEYFIDLSAHCLRAYRGQATAHEDGWKVEESSPPLVYRQGMGARFANAENYSPVFQAIPDDSTPYESFNAQRQEAAILLGTLRRLGEVSLDIKIPYDS